MTIPKELIEKAIAGGWMRNYYNVVAGDLEVWNYHAIALDPSFWQALGKSLGWEQLSGGTMRWSTEAHRFYDLILRGKDTTDLWKFLLDN